MARVCTAGLAEVSLESGPDGPEIQLASDDPVRACLTAQYADPSYTTEDESVSAKVDIQLD